MTSRPRSMRGLPAVEILLRHPILAAAGAGIPRLLLVESVRAELARERVRLRAGSVEPVAVGVLAERALCRARDAVRPQLRRVLNATGVVLHTNLGRAPLAAPARAAVAGFTNAPKRGTYRIEELVIHGEPQLPEPIEPV